MGETNGRRDKMKLLVTTLAVICLVAACSSLAIAAEQLKYGYDDFEWYNIGDGSKLYIEPPDPSGWWMWGDSNTEALPNRWDRIEAAPDDASNQVVHITDVIGVADTKNTHLRTNFTPGPLSSGIWGAIMDVRPLQDNGPFKIQLTNWNGWTSGFNWCVGLGFGSTAGNTFFPGMTAGAHLGLQVTTTSWVDTTVAYSANTWYTVKFAVDVDNLMYQAAFGPRGGPLVDVTGGWLPWITGAGTPPTTFGGMMVATSNKSLEGAELLLDNVYFVPEPSSMLALAGMLGLVPVLRRRRK
jgi:hypothetical protein